MGHKDDISCHLLRFKIIQRIRMSIVHNWSRGLELGANYSPSGFRSEIWVQFRKLAEVDTV